MNILLFFRNKLSSILTIIVGLITIREAIHLYPYSFHFLSGDHAFPALVGTILVLCGTILFFTRNRHIQQVRFPDMSIRMKMVGTVLLLFIYCILMNYLGYILCTAICVLFLIRIIGGFRWIFCCFLSLIFTSTSYYIFVVLLKTPLPLGILPL